MKTLALLSALVLATPGHAATPRHPDALDPVRVELALPRAGAAVGLTTRLAAAR